jgi:hypothetical protein
MSWLINHHIGLYITNKELAHSYNPDIVKTIELGRVTQKNEEGEDVDYVYALYYASDVQYDPNDPEDISTYEDMSADLEAIMDSFVLI